MNPNTNSSISIVHITNCTDFSAADEEIPLLSITNNCNGNCSINDSIQKPASSGIWKCKQYLYLCPQWHHYQVVHCKIALTFSNKFPTNPKYSLKPSVGMRIMMMIVVRIWYRSWRVEYYNKNMIGINLPSYLYLEKGIRWRKTTSSVICLPRRDCENGAHIFVHCLLVVFFCRYLNWANLQA